MPTCASCGEENPDRARFCLNCGAQLAAEPVGRKERKFATALFADLVGSTTLAEREDPEVVQSVVGRAFDRLAEEVERYGGLLEKFMGDAVLAVFGVPKTHEDDPERAVRAGIEMQAVLSELNRAFVLEGKPELAMRIGVEAGEVLVDLERATGPRDRMLTGDAVNTAARLQTAAEPGHVVVGPGVYASTKDVVDYRELAPIELKGKAQPVPAWDALRIRAKRRGERPSLGLEARLIGRDDELAVLKQTLHRVESEGRPALVTIVGPAGVGKSRLAAELLKHVEGLPQFIYWRRGRCLAYGNTSYSALADAIKAQCEILEDDPSEVAERKADAAVLELFGDDSIAPLVRALIGPGAPRRFSREDLFDAWRRFLERMAARYPLVLVLEDIHWADEGLLDFVEHLADWAQGPLMVLALARPELFEIRPTWGGGKRNVASIYLDPLTPEEDAAMIDDLLSGGISDELRKVIVERSEGNPLYTEEIVRTLIDDGVLRATEAARWEEAKRIEEVELPRSIQGLIAARLDGLPDDEKAILQDAAVVGRVFWTGSVARLSDRGLPEIREALGRLRVKELVLPHDPSSFSDELEFSFRHNLIRDGAYDSLPKSLRVEKHAGVARWAQEKAGDRADEIAELIASHYLGCLGYMEELGQAGPEREELERSAYRWAKAAGERATRLWQRAEALRWYREAVRLAEVARAPEPDRATLARAHVRACWGTATNDEFEQACRAALDRYRSVGDEEGVGWTLSQLAGAAFQRGDDREVETLSDQAIARLEPLGDTEALSDALHTLGWYHWRRGRLDQAEPILRRSLEVARNAGSADHLTQAVHSLGLTLGHAGRRQEGLELVEESYVLAKDSGDFALLMRVYNNLPAVLSGAGEYARAEAILREGLEAARKAGARGNLAWIVGSLGDVLTETGRLEEAEGCLRESAELAEAVSDMPLVGMRLGALSWVRLLRGGLDEAEEIAGRAEILLRENPEPQSEIGIYVFDGFRSVARGREEEAVEQLRRGVELARGFEVGWGVFVFPELVRLLLRLGRAEEAGTYRDLSEGRRSPLEVAMGEQVEGLLAADPREAVRWLRAAAERFEELGTRLELARCLLDLGRSMRRAGEDARSTLERARDLLVECDARLFLPEAEAALAEA